MERASGSSDGHDGVDRSEGFFKALVESRSGLMLLFGRDGIVHYASPSVDSVSGFSPERVIGASVWEILRPEDRGKVEEAIEAGGATPRSEEFGLRFGTEKPRIVRGSVQSFLDDPNVNGVVLVGREASQSAKTSKAREKETDSYHTAFDEAPIGLARVGPDGRWLRVNRYICRLLGYEREELIGRTFQEITHSDDILNDLNLMQQSLGGAISSAVVEKRFVRKDYSVVWTSVAATLVRDESGEPSYYACVIQDITRRREAEEISRVLTGRDLKVLSLLARGETNPRIAAELNLSLSAAKVCVSQVVQKLDATDRTHAAVRAAMLGLLDLEK